MDPVSNMGTYFCFASELYFDGACRGNPGPAAIGFVLYNEQRSLAERFSSFLGERLTNNIAEYKALIAGLQHALDRGITHIIAYGDSQLVCKQVNGEYEIRNPLLRRYYSTVWELLQRFEVYEVQYIPREENSDADSLANNGFNCLHVDNSPAARNEVVRRCRNPASARKYILEKRCEGTAQMDFILATIQAALPNSYAAVMELCRELEDEMGMTAQSVGSVSRLLVIS